MDVAAARRLVRHHARPQALVVDETLPLSIQRHLETLGLPASARGPEVRPLATGLVELAAC